MINISNSHSLKRTFVIGDECLYYKIYCGISTSDEILLTLAPIVKSMVDGKVVNKWFFIRYADAEPHLRIRFFINANNTNLSHAIKKIYVTLRPLVFKGLIWNIQLDTYQREIERYGQKTMEQSEEIFYHDSVMIVDVINWIENKEAKYRWMFGIIAINEFLTQFQIPIEKRQILTEKWRNNFYNEFGIVKESKLQLDKKFRNQRFEINQVLSDSIRKNNNQLYPLYALVYNKSVKLKNVIKDIIELDRSGLMEVPIDDFLQSHIHLMLNRLFLTKQRLHEMVMYDFLSRYYRSELAKVKYH